MDRRVDGSADRATANLVQAMFNNTMHEQRSQRVAAALAKAPKQGELAIPKALNDMAKAMIS